MGDWYMRPWYRRASLLGNPQVEDSIRRELERRYPTKAFLFNIDVTGRPENPYLATVRVSNFDYGINVSETAKPEEFGCDTLAAVIGTANRLIADLEQSGKLPRP